jgi:TolB-like protein/Tfp pilus assembly protein PilF
VGYTDVEGDGVIVAAPISLPNYRFLSVLGEGGMGKVWLAEQLNPHRKVAIKIIEPDDRVPPALLRALTEEGQTAALFEHDNLVRVIECGMVDNHYFLVMQYLPGGTLEERLRESPLDAEEVVRVFSEIANALTEIHGQGYIHRNIKPGNILFTEAGKPVLADFGIAKQAESVGAMTSDGHSLGTPTYMSPEQIRNDTLDGRSDLYSLGVVMHEAATGSPPFAGASEHDLKEAHLRSRAPRLTAGRALQPVIDRLLAKDPNDRYEDANQLVNALASLDPSTEAGASTVPIEATAPVPASPTSWYRGIFRELIRRKVLRTAGIYGVAAYTVTEIATFLFENFGAQLWANRLLAALFVAGFPVAMLLSWVFDFEAGGIKRTRYQAQSTHAILAAAVVLMLVGTGGLFYLIFPTERLASIVTEPNEPIAAGRAPINTIAVLPFTNMSGDPDDEYFGDGLADTILNELHKLDGLSLIARTSSFSYKGQNLDVRRIGSELNAGALLEGSVQRGGGQLRIIAQLIDTNTGTHLWSETFDRSAEDLFAIQDEIAMAMAIALGREIRSSLRAEGERPPGGSLAAYDAYLKGKEYRHRLDLDRVNLSVAFFEEAVRRDPNYAVAWAGLAEARMMAKFLAIYPFSNFTNDPIKTQSVWYGLPFLFEDLLQPEDVVAPLERAMSLAPHLPRVLLSEAIISARRYDLNGAVGPLREILDADPDHPEALRHYALVLRHLHRYSESLEFLQRAEQLDPQSLELQVDLIMGLSYVGESTVVLARYEDLIQRYPEYQSIIGTELMFTAIIEGRPNLALRKADEFGLDNYGGLRILASHYLGFTPALDALPPEDVSRLAAQPGFNHLPSFLLHWFHGNRHQVLNDVLPRIRAWAEIWPSPGAIIHAARVELALGRFESALADLESAESKFPDWIDWQDNTALMHNAMPYLDGLTHALILERLGLHQEAEKKMNRVMATIDRLERGGGGYKLLAPVKAKALWLQGQRDEALQVLEAAFEDGLLMPPGMDLEWRAVFGEDPAILAFEQRMDGRRSTLRGTVVEPDLSEYMRSEDFLMRNED